jgi:hypothetical protein
MRTVAKCLAGLAWLCQAGLLPAAATPAGAAGGPAVVPAIEAPVRLVAPAAEEVLVGGAPAAIAWEPLEVLDRLGPVEEWEAFLSLDGGSHYTIRLTPHLSRTLHRFVWSVPPTPSADARILLRFGDERREHAWRIDRRFRIVVARGGERGDLIAPARALAPGEAPLPGEAGVASWVEGTRQGAALRQVVYAAPGISELGIPVFCRLASLAVTEAASSSLAPPRRQVVGTAPARRAPSADRKAASPRPIEPLLLTHRLNE